MINFAVYQTQVGLLKMTYEQDAIIFIEKTNCKNENCGRRTELTDEVYTQLEEYFQGIRKEFDFKYSFYGTEFQKKVWNELCKIPYGETRSYKEVAIAIGDENASRAVGRANNKNPIMIVIPCHRVVGSAGKMVGYSGGLKMKEVLLEIERNALK